MAKKSCMTRLLDCFGGAQVRGSMSAAARELGVDRAVVSYWHEIGYIPSHNASAIERATSGRVKAMDVLAETMRLHQRKRRGS